MPKLVRSGAVRQINKNIYYLLYYGQVDVRFLQFSVEKKKRKKEYGIINDNPYLNLPKIGYMQVSLFDELF